MNRDALEYYERLLLWIEAMRLLHRAEELVRQLTEKEDTLKALDDPSAKDFDQAAFLVSDGTMSACELLLRNVIAYGAEHLSLEPYHHNQAVCELAVLDLLQNTGRLDYISKTIRLARKDALARPDHESISFEDLEWRFQHKVWRNSRIHDGLGTGGDLFDRLWAHGSKGQPPLRDHIPWLKAWYEE